MSLYPINNSLLPSCHTIVINVPNDDVIEKVQRVLQQISLITDSCLFYIKMGDRANILVLMFPSHDTESIRKVLGLKVVKDLLHPSGSTHHKKTHTRSNSYDKACQRVEEEEKLEKENRTLNHWMLNRTCYTESHRVRLEEFKNLLQAEIHALLHAILALSSKEIHLAKEPGLSKSLDSCITASLALSPLRGTGPIWSYFSPIDYIFNGKEKERFEKISRYLNSYEKMDRISRYTATLITAYYRVEVLDPLCNLTYLEEKLWPFKQALLDLKKFLTSSSAKEQYFTGTDDKKEQPNIRYKEHWDSLCTLILGQLFNNILLSEELFGSDVSMGELEMAKRLVESLIFVSDEPLSFETTSINYTLSRLALLAYETQGVVYDFVRNKWHYKEHHFFYLDDIQAFFIADDKRVIISFRGTTTLTHWPLYNFRTQSVDVEGKKVHSGFWDGLKKMQPYIRRILQEGDEREIYLTGHSLGGALAFLAAFDLTTYLDNRGAKIHLCTFGQPRCGDQELVETVGRKVKAYLRYENYLDPVPHLPRHFQQGGKRRWMNAKGEVVDEERCAEAFARLEKKGNLTTFNRVINFVCRSETKAIRDNPINWMLHFSNHSMIEYHKHLRNADQESYTPVEYIEEVAVKEAREAAPCTRREKQNFSLSTQVVSSSRGVEAFNFKPLEFQGRNELMLRHGLVRPNLAEAIGVGLIGPYFASGKGIQMFVDPQGYDRDARWHHFRILKIQNPALQLFDYTDQESFDGVKEALFLQHKTFYEHPEFPSAVLPYLIAHDNAGHIRFLAGKNIPINRAQEDGSPLVHRLVSLKCYNSFEALVTVPDYMVDARDGEGKTVLHHVAQHGELKAFDILDENGRIFRILNLKNNAGETAIVVATQLRHFKLVSELLSKYPDDIELKDSFLSDLVAAGAESTITSLFRTLPRDRLGSIVTFENACDGREEDSILFKTQNRNILKLLIENGIDLTKTQRGSDKTLLYMLAKNNDVELVELFIETLKENHPESYWKVLDQEVQSNEFNSITRKQKLKTALIIAAEKNNYKVVLILIAAVVDISKEADGLTALDYAPRSLARSQSYQLLRQARLRNRVRCSLRVQDKEIIWLQNAATTDYAPSNEIRARRALSLQSTGLSMKRATKAGSIIGGSILALITLPMGGLPGFQGIKDGLKKIKSKRFIFLAADDPRFTLFIYLEENNIEGANRELEQYKPFFVALAKTHVFQRKFNRMLAHSDQDRRSRHLKYFKANGIIPKHFKVDFPSGFLDILLPTRDPHDSDYSDSYTDQAWSD